MMSNYKFQDLAKFIEDIKFLIGKDGGAVIQGEQGNKAMVEHIFRIIKLILMWIFLFIMAYVIYKLIFYGYPRFPVDLMRFKFNNKVSVKSIIGNETGPLYNPILLLKDEGMKEAMLYFDTNGFQLSNGKTDNDYSSIFHDIDRIITEGYKGEFDASYVEEALNDYYKYYGIITSKLGLKGETAQNKIVKLKNLYANVFSNYLKFYQSELLIRENALQCLKNTGKDDKKRGEMSDAKKQLQIEYDNLMRSINCKKIETECEFAKLFIDPNFTLVCSDELEKAVKQEMTNRQYFEKKKRYTQLEKEINKRKTQKSRASSKGKKRLNEIIKEKENEQNSLKIEMIDIKNDATRAAKEKLKEKPPQLPIANPTYKDIIIYQDEDRIYPNTDKSKANNKRLHNTIYVPCYDFYKQYCVVNKATLFSKFTGSDDNGLSEDELIAFVFLSDVERQMENVATGKVNKTPIIERVLNTYIAIEGMSEKLREILTNPTSPGEVAQYLIFPDDNILSASISELHKNRGIISKLYKNNDNEAINITIENDYTYYLMEIFAYMQEFQDNDLSVEQMPYVYQRYVELMNQFEYNKNALIAYLNLPVEQQRKPEMRLKFGISRQLSMFVRSHPIFSLLYLGTEKSVSLKTDSEKTMFYNRIMGMFLNLLSSDSELQKVVHDIEEASRIQIEQIISIVQSKVFNIKKLIISLHMINIFFSHYRDSVTAKDPISKVKISRDGLVEIYDQQNISPEFGSFFGRLFEPFKRDFLDGKIKAAWRKAFIGKRFNPNIKDDKWNLSYWREFNAFWVDFIGKKMDGMMKAWWKSIKNYSKPRWKK